MDSRREFKTRNIESIQMLHTSSEIKMMTFNVLAEQLGTPKSFPFVSQENLSWEIRSERILKYIKEVDADIVCLQEVDHPEEFFAALKDVYADYKFHKKGGWHRDGTMMLWKSRFEITGFTIKKFTQIYDHKKFGAQFFIVCDFEDTQNNNHEFSVLSTHLKAKDFVDVRAWQAKYLSEWIKANKNDTTLFMLGDFNGDRDEKGIETIRNTGFENVFDFVENMGQNEKESLWTTMKYHADKVRKLRYIDYMWHDPKKAVVKSVYMPPCLNTIDLDVGLPDAENPSDHIPLVAVFAFVGCKLDDVPTLTKSTEKNVIILKRPWDTPDTKACQEHCCEFYSKVDQSIVKYNIQFATSVQSHEVLQNYGELHNKGFNFSDEYQKIKFDLAIVIGGDGSLLYANNLFGQEEIPPVLCFAAGSLGFLCEHKIENTQARLAEVHEHFFKGVPLDRISRSRALTTIYRKECCLKVADRMSSLNDCLIERAGTSMVRFDIYVDDNLAISDLGCDGLIFCTSTGSTAYNLSVNGPICQNEVDCLILNTIAPFSINFRPIVFDKLTKIRVKLNDGNRGEARLVSDGQKVVPFEKGDIAEISVDDKFLHLVPSPLAAKEGAGSLFVQKLSRLFNWAKKN